MPLPRVVFLSGGPMVRRHMAANTRSNKMARRAYPAGHPKLNVPVGPERIPPCYPGEVTPELMIGPKWASLGFCRSQHWQSDMTPIRIDKSGEREG